MTSNQLAYGANQINQQIADESARHNKTVEAETMRHNEATEQLTAAANQYVKDANDETARHNSVMEAINKEYNTTWLALQKSQGDEKLRIQSELALLEQRKTDELNRHNVRSEELSALVANNEKLKIDENERHNKATEGISSKLAELEEKKATISELAARNQALYWNGVIANDQLRINLTHEANLMDSLIKLENTKLGYMQWGTNKQLVKSQIAHNWINSATGALKDLGNTLANSIGVLKIAQ